MCRALSRMPGVDRLDPDTGRDTQLEAGLDADGRVIVVSSEHRSQLDNIEAATVRMQALLSTALVRPKHRKKRKPSRASKMRRLDEKRRHGEAKRRRSGRGDD